MNKLCYARFADCNHKICSDCVNKMIITNGCCPFHSNEIKNLVVCITTQSINDQLFSIKEYMESNYQMITNAVFNETVNVIVHISETVFVYKEYVASLLTIYKTKTNRMSKTKTKRIKIQLLETHIRAYELNNYRSERPFGVQFRFLQNYWKMIELFKNEDCIKNEYITSAVNLFNDHMAKLFEAFIDLIESFMLHFRDENRTKIEISYKNLFERHLFHPIQHPTLPCEMYNKVILSLQNNQN